MGWALWALAGLVVGAQPAAEAPRARVVSPLVKVRPGPLPAGAAEARVSLARGECEAVQVVLPRGAARVELAAPARLGGPRGAALDVALSRVGFVPVRTPSNHEGAAGDWPDPLLPLATPAEPQRPAVLWAEVCAPGTQAPGRYQGALALAADGVRLAPLPFTAEVQPFALPATATLPTSFGVSLYGIARGHGLDPESPEARALLADYARALLAHRVSAHGLSMAAPPVRFEGGRAQVDWRAYDAEVGPFLAGTALPGGARFTTAEVRDSKLARTDAEKVAYYRAWVEHFRQQGWKARLFFYAKDEPKPGDVPLVRAQAARVRQAGGVPVLVTSPLVPELAPSADILTPVLNCFFPRPGPPTCRAPLTLASARARLPRSASVWWYQSCQSHGCGGGPAADPALEAAFSGWATYVVDVPAPLNRAMGPLAFLTGVDGELYYDTVQAYYGRDPWQDVWAFGGNGDGTLFYPGTPARLGGAAHAPVVSVRLKHIRDGLEDYEYLALLAARGDPALARTLAARLARSGHEVERDVRVWEDVRQKATARLRELTRAGEYAGPPGVSR